MPEDPTTLRGVPVTLRCLGGRAAPPEIATDIAILERLPAAAQERFYRVLGPCLSEELPSSVESLVDELCTAFEIDSGALARALRASRFLLRQAAALDLPAAAFAEDLAKLRPGTGLADVLMPGYEAAKLKVRTEAAKAAILDHGKTVDRVDWRVDVVTSSNRAEAMRVAVAVVTLGFVEGDKRDRVTLQMLPETIRELRAICDRILKAGSGPSGSGT